MIIQGHTADFLKDWLFNFARVQMAELKLLLGDGSNRKFYRLKDAKTQESFILISDPEWKQTQDYAPHQEALERAGLPVPAFKKFDPQIGLLLMQDLGDELLQIRIQKNPEEKDSWLDKAALLLADLHGKLFPVPVGLPVLNRQFDEQKLFEELSFTLQHLRETYLGLPSLDSKKLTEVRSFCGALSKFRPLVFCHRDYHCRNLLVFNSSLWMIDFQDARLGSPVYDLASLLFDAYVPLSDSNRIKLIQTYKTRLSNYPLSKEVDWSQFQTELYRMAYQRTLKAAGSFASFWTRYQKNSHLVYLKPALQMASALEKTGVIPKEVAEAFEITTLLGLLDGKKD